MVIVVLMCSSWGFFAHKQINRQAIFSLPVNLSQFYRQHMEYIVENAVAADKRCYVDTAESPRHYIDLDALYEGEDGALSAPLPWKAATEKFSERRLLATGIIPWQIERSYRQLTFSFANKDLRGILRHSADLGHYVADAHVPLHTTQNYNGHMTNQRGIHAFWESRLPERFARDYDFFVGRAKYIGSPLDAAWHIIQESHRLVDSVLTVEKELDQSFRLDRKYAFVERNLVANRNYSEAYTVAYHDGLRGMVERRMRESIRQVASFWFSAWVDAGQPDLISLIDDAALLDTIKVSADGKRILGREEWHE